MKPGLRLSQEFEILPHSTWQQILRWYKFAPGQKPIIRYLHDFSDEGSVSNYFQYELYPPIFTLRKVLHEKGVSEKVLEERMLEAPRIVASRSHKYQEFLKRVKSLLNIPVQTKIKLYSVLQSELPTESNDAQKDISSMPSPPASRETSPSRPQPQLKMVIDGNAFKALDTEDKLDQIELADVSMDANYNGHVTLGTVGLSMDQVLIIQELPGKSKGDTRNDSVKKGVAKSLAAKENAPSEASSGRASPAIGMLTRGRNRSKGRSKGTVGLNNLMNTCYMNSALQCMRACEELTLYFLGKSCNDWILWLC
jgi:ubiquitin carboxyl-terminal hydrolase 4/11